MKLFLFFKFALMILFDFNQKSICFQRSAQCPFANWNNNRHLNYINRPHNENQGITPHTDENFNPKINPVFSKNSIESWTDYSLRSESHGLPNLQNNNGNFDSGRMDSHCAVAPFNCSNKKSNYFYRTLDGSCNNMVFPEFGMAMSRYTRLMPPKYGDGIYSPTVSTTGGPLPNPRLLSLQLYGEKSVADEYRTMASMHWGQLVAHDLSRILTGSDAGDCCANALNRRCMPISLEASDPVHISSGKTCLQFERSKSDEDIGCLKTSLPYTEKISSATGYLDLSFVYGNSLEESRRLRQFRGGLLKTATLLNSQEVLPILTDNGECTKGISQCFAMAEQRNQMVPALAALHTVFALEHNRIAVALERINPNLYSDEKLFQKARKINIGQFQKITYYDWLPLIVGLNYARMHGLVYEVSSEEHVQDYDKRINAAPYAEFSSVAFRYLHNEIPGWFSLIDSNRSQTLRISDFMERTENVQMVADNFNSIIGGLILQLHKQPDDNIDEEIKHYFLRKPFEQFGTDLKSIDIQRGRDFGIPPYNDYREYCGLPRAKDWSGFLGEISAEVALMQQFYATPDDVDLSIGGSLEQHLPESTLGPTFQCIVGRQFLKSRRGDRFFFEHENICSGFTREQLSELRKASLSGLICNNVRYVESIQMNSFVSPGIRNIALDCDRIPRVNLNKWQRT